MKQLRFFFLPIVMICYLHASAYDFMVDGIAYNVNGNEATVTYEYYQGINSQLVEANIPETVTFGGVTYSVTAIGELAFYHYTGLTNVTIPNSVTSIGSQAFDYCTNLRNVTIGNSVTSIGSLAFQYCFNLSNVIFGNSISSIGQNAFYRTAWLSNQPNGLVYAGPVVYCYKGTMSDETSIELKEGTKGIADDAFNGINGDECPGLTSITIPSSVIRIGSQAFSGCNNLINVAIPNSVTFIGERAFSGCSSLSNTTIPNSVTYIGEDAFNNTGWFNSQPDGLVYAGLVAYKYKGTMPEGTNIVLKEGTNSISGKAFYQCTGLTYLTIPSSVTSIGESAFTGCSNLLSVDIPNSVNSIEYGAFSFCSSLKSVNIPNSVNTIEGAVFYGCNSLASITIPNSITFIGGGAFGRCTSLTSVNIPNSVSVMRDRVFSGCTGLKHVTIGNNVKSINILTFENCYNLRQFFFNASNCIIEKVAGNDPFQGCPTLTSLQFGNNVEHIPYGIPRFNMTNDYLVLPNSLQFIDSLALDGTCNAVVIGDSIKRIAKGTFPNGISVAYVSSPTPIACSSGAFANPETLYVPAGCKGRYLMSDGWCEFANIIEGSYARVTDLTLDVDSATMLKNETMQLNSTILPANHTATTLKWWSSNESVATIGSTGLVTAVEEGEADIFCYVDGKTAICHISVVKNLVDSILLNYNELLLDWDNIVDLTATVLPENASQEVTWSVPDNNNIYARVVGNNLRVMAMRSGIVTVTAKSDADPNISANCIITIQIPDVNGDTNLNISDVTALIDYLLTSDESHINICDADVNRDGSINISDVTELIDKLLRGG